MALISVAGSVAAAQEPTKPVLTLDEADVMMTAAVAAARGW